MLTPSPTPSPPTRDLVLIGGGHAHVAVVVAFGMRAEVGVRVTLVSREAEAAYSGMVPGLLAGHYSHDEAHVDLRRLCGRAGVRFVEAAATGIDLAGRVVQLGGGRPGLRFDVLSLDTGSTPTVAGIVGAREHGLAVKPVAGFLEGWAAAEERMRAAPAGAPFRVLVIGGGAGGVELALSLQQRCRDRGLAGAEVEIVTDGEQLLPRHAPAARRAMAAAVAARGLRVQRGCSIVRLEAGLAHGHDGRTLPFDLAILATPAAAPAWLAETGLALDAAGFVRVDKCLRSLSHPFVFAAGDVAAFQGRALPKSGVYAVRQGPVLAKGLRAALRGQAAPVYRPQLRTLALISTGDRYAVAAWGPFALEGRWLWRLKDRIDRRWMRMYSPDAGAASGAIGAAEDDGLRCGGCGAKTSGEVLRAALGRLPGQAAADVPVGLAAGDDAAVIAPPAGQMLVQSVDQFRSLVDDPWLFGRIVANHCLGDLHAMGAWPHSAQALVALPPGVEAQQAELLHQLLAGVTETLREAGAVLLGGHTSEGAELSVGLVVNGWIEAGGWASKAGARPGDALILTKALGTGLVFAADMRGAAAGPVVAAALASMLRPLAAAAAIARAHGVHAMTDVTGFGLVGHLVEMLAPAGLEATLDLDALPVLPGAADLARRGARSSLHGANSRLARHITGETALAEGHAHWPFLFDPQTAGGLLLAVPPEVAKAICAALHAAGDGLAVRIGSVLSPGEREAAPRPGLIRISP